MVTSRHIVRLIAVATLLSAAAACGGRGATGTTLSAATATPAVARTVGQQEQPADSEAPALHRPATWQDTRGFTPYADFRPDQILLRFSDELPPGSSTGSPGGQPGFNGSSVLYQNAEHAWYARSLANQYGLTVLTNQEAYVSGFNFCGYQLPAGTDTEALMQRILDENPATVRYAEYNAIRKTCYTPDDPYLDYQWHHSVISSYDAWDYYGSPEGVVIAVLDTGIDTDHEDLSTAILDLWDTYDLDLVNADWKPEDNDPSWESGGHGTHVAGIAAAFGDNSTGVAGVAWNTWILPIQVLGGVQDNPDAVEQGIVLATQLGADVINLSLGGYFPSLTEKEACEYAYVNDVIVVAAAGNDNLEAQIHYPAGVPTVIAVGATDTDDYKTPYSNYGWWVDIAAPGGNGYGNSDDIYSTVIGSYNYMSGTSMASPMVAGAAALIKSIAPGYEIDEYRGWLEAGGDSLANQSEWNNDWIKRLNVSGAHWYPQNQLPTVTITSPTDGAPVSGLTDIELEATDDGGSVFVNLYVDGILLSGGSLAYEWDFTDFYPGECNIIAEVIDQDHQHAFDEITVIVTDPRTFTIPYSTGFNTTSETDGWTPFNLSGDAHWQQVPDGTGGQMLELEFCGYNYDWLETPNFDASGLSQCRFVFWSDFYVPYGPASFCWWQGENNGEEIPFEDLVRLDAIFPGYKNYWMVDLTPSGSDPIKAMFSVRETDHPTGDTSYVCLDNFALTTPTVPPTVTIMQPAEGMHVSGIIDFNLIAVDDYSQVVETQFYANDEFLVRDTIAPFSTSLDTRSYYNGSLELGAVAFDLDWYDYDGDGNPWDYGTYTHSVIVENEQIDSLTPASGFYTDIVDIEGSDFDNYKPGAQRRVLFTGASSWVSATPLYWSDTLIRTTVPEGTVTGPVRVCIDESYAESPGNFTVTNPFSALHFISPEDSVMFTENFGFHLPKQPGLAKVEVTVAGHPGKTLTFNTFGSEIEVTGVMDITGLNTGEYSLQAIGYYGTYSEVVDSLRFFILALPGDYNGDGVVNDGDSAYLRNYLVQFGEVGDTRWAYLPFLDATGDGMIDERDLAYVGYHFGETL